MKKPVSILAVTTLVLFAACNKQSSTAPANNNTNNTASTISTDDVSEAVTNAVSGSTSGMASQSETTAQLAATITLACGGTSDTTISGASPQGAIISYSYDLNFTRTCVCTNGVRTGLNTTFTGITNYSVILMSGNDSASAQASVTGLDAAATNYVLNETYTTTGTQQSLILNKHSFTSTLTITTTNLNISKSSQQIVSGTANVQFTGTGSGGTTVDHTALITFLGNNEATLAVDNGTPKTISW